MGLKTSGDDPAGAFHEVISLLQKNLKYLELLDLDPVTVKAYKKIIAYLKRRTEKDIAGILGTPRKKPRTIASRSDPTMSDEEIGNLSGEQITALLYSPTVSRKFLERLASIRFAVSTGALSALRSRDALVDKLNTLVSHEGTHDAISRAIGSDEDSAT